MDLSTSAASSAVSATIAGGHSTPPTELGLAYVNGMVPVSVRQITPMITNSQSTDSSVPIVFLLAAPE